MSYLALARKYRPSSFEGIDGQQHVTRTLAQAIARDRIHHAYLFCGARGVGKTSAARAFTRALNCAEGPTVTPCGVCVSCRAMDAGNSPDLIEIDGASNNSVEDIRELRETVRYPPQGRHKIYIVDEVHMLSKSAFNALLKTLEEPPPHVIFLFATTDPHKIPDTILSRVLRFDFKRIPVDVVTARLRHIVAEEQAEATDDALRLLARAGEGSMRDAQSLLDKILSSADGPIDVGIVTETLGMVDRTLIVDGLAALVQGDTPALIALIARVHQHGVELGQFTTDLLEILRHATLLAFGDRSAQHVDLPDAERHQIKEVIAETSPEHLTRLFHALIDVQDRVARADRPRMILEMSLARLAAIRPVVPLAGLIDRLERLEATTRPSDPGRGGGAGSRGRSPVTGGPRHRRVTPAARPRHRGGRHGGARRHLSDDASDDERWAALRTLLATLSPPADDVLSGLVRRTPRAVIVTVPAGRQRALAKRAAERDDVRQAVHHCYGPRVELMIEASLASVDGEIDEALEASVRAHPAVQRLMSTMGAKLLHVQPDATPDEENG